VDKAVRLWSMIYRVCFMPKSMMCELCNRKCWEKLMPVVQESVLLMNSTVEYGRLLTSIIHLIPLNSAWTLRSVCVEENIARCIRLKSWIQLEQIAADSGYTGEHLWVQAYRPELVLNEDNRLQHPCLSVQSLLERVCVQFSNDSAIDRVVISNLDSLPYLAANSLPLAC
jgi:hypothetical protein